MGRASVASSAWDEDEDGERGRSISLILRFEPATTGAGFEVFRIGAGEEVGSILERDSVGVGGSAGLREVVARETMAECEGKVM